MKKEKNVSPAKCSPHDFIIILRPPMAKQGTYMCVSKSKILAIPILHGGTLGILDLGHRDLLDGVQS